jgi:TetR/AcrR family transcriptional repressor of nem operon
MTLIIYRVPERERDPMKKSKEDTARSRERILDSASRRFREGGFGGVSVKDLMGEAGLTHGAFYAHFPSKEALMSAACEQALAETARRLTPAEGQAPQEALTAFLDRYLSAAHVERPARGCAIAALGGEAARESDDVRDAFATGIATMIDRFAALVPGEDEADRRDRAIATVAEAVGAIVLARAVAPGALRDEIVAAARRDLLPPQA